ncbi:acyltransferase family protein [Rhizobium sp. CNPSo 3968]|uniref:acyltransferase family protein n=1 Tax=Rhizobium sp. CNPSo 3968 TaxID=3021408 RepID=UPI00254DD96B|nr:acyltransferase family protein [Rhizobium sp. CNPSo 3968]MDK4720148.1 acyltransferase family protein [Rhizobium sp. CNPSo 3968]
MRISELDGLRGWAALSVVLFHLFWESFGGIIPAYRSFFVNGLINGQTAIAIFFLVSGAALSAPFHMGRGQNYLISAAIRRHLRLALPILAAALLVYLLFHLHLMKGPEASVFVKREDWRGLNWVADVTLKNVFYFSFAGVFAPTQIQSDMVPFLWTMAIEFAGSIILFLALFCSDAMRNPGMAFLVAGCFLLVVFPSLACFFFGSLIVERRIKQENHFVLDHPIIGVLSILGLYIFSCAALAYAIPAVDQIRTVVCALVLYQALNFRPFRKFLSTNRISIFLGRISFPIFLTHFAVIGAFMAPLIIRFHDHLGPKTTFAIGVVTAMACVGVARAFLPIERIGHIASGKFTEWVVRPHTNSIGQSAAAPNNMSS